MTVKWKAGTFYAKSVENFCRLPPFSDTIFVINKYTYLTVIEFLCSLKLFYDVSNMKDFRDSLNFE